MDGRTESSAPSARRQGPAIAGVASSSTTRPRAVRDARSGRGRDDSAASRSTRQPAASADRSRHRRVRRQRPRLLADARRLDAEHHQDPDGPRRDEDCDAVAHRRGGRADRGRARARGHDQARRRGGRRAGGVRGRRRSRSCRGRRSSRSWATSTTARRRCSTRSATRRSSRPRPAGSRSTSAPTRSTSTAGRSRSSTRPATKRSPRCAPAARRSPTSQCSSSPPTTA